MRYASPRRPQYSCFSTLPPSPSTMVLRWVASASTCCALISWRAIRRCSYRAIPSTPCFDYGIRIGGRRLGLWFHGTPDHPAWSPKGPPATAGRLKGGRIAEWGDRGKANGGDRWRWSFTLSLVLSAL